MPTREAFDGLTRPLVKSDDDGLTHTPFVVAEFADTYRDPAGRLTVAQPYIIHDSDSLYDASPLIWQTITSGAGNTAAHSATSRMNVMTLGGTAAGHVVYQTYDHVPYQPWRTQEFAMTGVMGTAVANVTKRLGAFDALNGVFFQQSGDGTMSVVRRTTTTGSTVDHATPQASWNINTAADFDPSKAQVFLIRFLYLGVALVEYGIYLDGEVTLLHRELLANVLPTPYMQYATLPLRYEMSSSQAASATMARICTAVNSNGGVTPTMPYRFAVARTGLVSVASEQAICAIRPATTYNSIVNRSMIHISHVHILAAGNPVLWVLRYYPPGTADPTSGGSWVQGSNSAAETKIDATSLSTTGSHVIAMGMVPTSGGASREVETESIDARFPLALDASGANSPLASATGANPAYIVLTALQIGGAATAAGVLEWSEVR